MASEDPTLPSVPGPDPDLDATRTAGNAATTPAAPGLPDRIGSYRPLRLLGQGGMGVVYEAEQDQPRRRVALKVIRPELATEGLRRRFAHESMYLGRLRHPGIAQVYEAGTADTPAGPLPFIAMELVDGRRLDAWVRERRPDLRTSVGLMIRLCDAVHHAHQRGLIHRDLKPGNVLVEAGDRPRVLDFGVARPADADLGASLVTSHGEIVGTLAYMSPEQLAGDPNDLDTRTDVYALGVILYEMLAGQSPLTLVGRPLEDALRAIREEEPIGLARRDARLAGDLSVIAAKAMAKDRERRYASANGLAMDLQRYLDDQPIVARPPGTVYLLRKFARRRRALVLGAAGVAAALVLGIVAATWQAVRATRAEKLAGQRLDQAQAVTGFLQDMLASVQPDEAQGRDVSVAEVLDRAAGDLAAGGLAARPAVEMALRRALGGTYQSLGRLADAERQLRRSLTLADSLLDPAAPERLLTALELNNNLLSRGRVAAAESLLTAVMPLLPAGGPLPVRALNQLADVRYAQGAWAVADSLRARVVDLVAQADRPDSLNLARAYVDRAFLLEQRGDLAFADSLVTLAAGIAERAYGAGDPRLIPLLKRRFDLAQLQGRFVDATAAMQQALTIADAVLPPDHPVRADVLWRLGMAQTGTGAWDAARTSLTEALRIREQVLGPVHRDVALTYESLGTLEQAAGRPDVAEEHLRRALAMREELFGHDSVGVVASLRTLGDLARTGGEPARAESLYVSADEILARLPEENHGLACDIANGIALSRQDQGRDADAEAAFRRAVDVQRAWADGPPNGLPKALTNLAANIYRQGRVAEAIEQSEQALALYRRAVVRTDDLLFNLGNLAFLYDKVGRYADADTLHREFIALAGELYGDQRPEQAGARARYSENLAKQGRWREAEAQATAMMAWRREHLREDDIKQVSGVVYLAEIFHAQGRDAEADSVFAPAEATLARRDDVPASIRERFAALRAALDAAGVGAAR